MSKEKYVDLMIQYNSLKKSSKDFIMQKKNEELITRMCEDLGVDEKKKKDLMKKYAKPKKDMNVPKKPKTAYILFCDDFRKPIMEESKSKSMGEISKLLAAKWNKLDDDSKQKYYKNYGEAKEIYDRSVKKVSK
tara:strand:- start:80 stop:481 length:402 start_codon:yes stop_codon:yes gene_type:complete